MTDRLIWDVPLGPEHRAHAVEMLDEIIGFMCYAASAPMIANTTSRDVAQRAMEIIAKIEEV